VTTFMSHEMATVPEIGRYHLITELARGGMGHVYLTVSRGPGGFSKLLAVKELKPGLCDDETYVAMFLEEARLAARLVHPNIVQTNEVASEGGRHFMVMEFLDGRSLHRIAKKMGAGLPVIAHLRIIADALSGLHYAHELRGFDGEFLGIVHRDVSPLNVFVTFNGQAKVLDFGIAKTADSPIETKRGVLKGRIAYMSPEQAEGAKVDRRADIYSAGVMIWEAAAGRRLWPRMSEAQILTRLLREGPPRLRSVQPQAPEQLDNICARAMALRREDRYPSAAELLCDLELHLARVENPLAMRDIGAIIGQAYEDERRQMNRVIEETLARISTGRSFGDGPGLESASQSQSAPATAAALGAAFAGGSAPSANRRPVLQVLGAGVLLLSVLFLGAHRGRSARSPAPPIAAGASAPLVSESTAEAPGKSHVTVAASPKMARIYLDEAVVPNPYVADPIRDATLHRLRIEAPGYEPTTRTLAFGDDIDLEITLDAKREPPIARRAAEQTKPAASPSPNCEPPYVVDIETGKKRWRLECL
jgi:eukaryotic-like serine/threonine-protein kinase